MGILDSLIGAAIGGGTAGSGQGNLMEVLSHLGGLDDVMNQLRQHAPDAVTSWIIQGANQHLTPERIQQILGHGPIAQAAQRMGISPEQVSEIVATQLPALIDRITPDGNNPGGGFGDLIGGILGGAGR